MRLFEPARMLDGAVVLVVGVRHTGKSVLVRDLLRHKLEHFGHGVVVSPDPTELDFFRDRGFDTHAAEHEAPVAVIEAVIDRQREELANTGRAATAEALVVLDNCMFDKNFLNSRCVRKLLMNAQHYKIFVVITVQYCGDMNPCTRGNIDYCFAMRDSITNRRKLHKTFFGMVPEFRDFCQVMDVATRGYGALVADRGTLAHFTAALGPLNPDAAPDEPDAAPDE